MEYTAKDLIEKLNLTKMALSKALKTIPFESKKLDTSSKPVKHYKYEDLPTRYKEKLIELGFEKEEVKATNISKTNFKGFTKKYLLASAQKQEKAIKKVRFIEFYLKKDVSVSQTKFIENSLKNSVEFDILGNVTVKMLNDWLVKYKEVKAKGENLIEAFVDGRGNERNSTALTKEQQEMAERYFLKQSHPIIRTIHLLMSSYFGKSMCSYDALNNYFKRWKKANPQLFMFANSPDKWKNNFLVALGSESEKALYRNHYWEFDATPADVICSDGKRYTILGLIDIATRRPIFKVEESNSVFAVTRLLRAGILKFGIPENIVIDNGKEFVSNHFASVCVNLDIQVHTTPPFSGDKKPFIERMFGTLARGLFRYIPAFIGHNVAMKSELQARESFAHRIMAIKKAKAEIRNKEEEDAFRQLWKIKKENVGIDISIALSKEQLQEVIDLWTERLYEQKEQKGINKTPISAWNSYTAPVQSIGDERMLDLLLGKSYEAKVGKKGIRMDNCQYWQDELLNYMGKTVKVMTNDNLGEVIVYNPNTMELICKAIDLEHYGISRESAAQAKKKQSKVIQQFNKTIKMAEEANDPTLMDVINAKENYEIGNTLATTKRTQVSTMLLDESYKLQEQDKAELETSKQYDFKNKDEDGKPKKVLMGGRPEFETFTDRFLWCLEHNDWTEKDKKLKELKPESYEMAFKEFEKRKLA